jgi:hypothetical protein
MHVESPIYSAISLEAPHRSRGFLRAIASCSLEKFRTNISALRYTIGVEIGNIFPRIAKHPSISRLDKGSLHVANEKVFPSFFTSRNDQQKIYLKILGVAVYV